MSAIEESVIEKIRQRAEAGLKKYGVTMERKDWTLRDGLVNAQQEAMDLCVYLERAIRDLDAANPEAEPPKAVDLSKCKRGDKLLRRDGVIVVYSCFDKSVYDEKHPYICNYERDARWDIAYAVDGKYFVGEVSSEDIIEVIGQ